MLKKIWAVVYIPYGQDEIVSQLLKKLWHGLLRYRVMENEKIPRLYYVHSRNDKENE